MGIRINGSKHRATQKLYSQLLTFQFEQQYDEMENWSDKCCKLLVEFTEELGKQL